MDWEEREQSCWGLAQLGNFPSCLGLATNGANRLVIRLGVSSAAPVNGPGTVGDFFGDFPLNSESFVALAFPSRRLGQSPENAKNPYFMPVSVASFGTP